MFFPENKIADKNLGIQSNPVVNPDGTLVGQGSLNQQLLNASDLVTTFNYLDEGLSTQRIGTIVYSSVLLELTQTQTFAYLADNETVSSITVS